MMNTAVWQHNVGISYVDLNIEFVVKIRKLFKRSLPETSRTQNEFKHASYCVISCMFSFDDALKV